MVGPICYSDKVGAVVSMRYIERQRRVGFSHSGAFPPGVKWLLIVNIAGARFLFDPLGLTPRSVIQVFGIYQLFTYMFLHSPYGFSHILFNMLALWMFGADLERTWGTRRFLQYYFLCGVGAGICVVIGNALYGTLDTRTIGASGAIYGVLLAFGLLFPDTTVLFSFLFPIKAKYFVMIIGAIAFMSSFAGSGGGVSHVAHLGGMLFGYLYLRSQFKRVDFFGSLRRQYEDWKVERARRKFQVYLRKRESDHDRWVH
jgi:membrane associated rhomboid family serine protease